jgi:hypothetical protein
MQVLGPQPRCSHQGSAACGCGNKPTSVGNRGGPLHGSERGGAPLHACDESPLRGDALHLSNDSVSNMSYDDSSSRSSVSSVSSVTGATSPTDEGVKNFVKATPTANL